MFTTTTQRRDNNTRRTTQRHRYCATCETLEDRTLLSVAVDQVHVLYLVPSNRTAQPGAVATLKADLLTAQSWFRDQMERDGFGPKTFQFETGSDGAPLIHVVNAPQPDDYYRGDPWGRVTQAGIDADLPIWQPSQVWLEFYEGQVMSPDGSIAGGFAGGFGYGSGDGPGVALLGGDGLATMRPADLIDDSPYDGTIRPELGPYPMVQDVTFPWFEGTTYSSIASSHLGATTHELAHAFGLGHDFINDANFNGDLMGNGLRGIRGWLRPDLYPTDDTHLSYGEALALNSSRYFNADQTFTENTQPTVSVLTSSGVTDPVDGQLAVHFTASDASGLTAALLYADGNLAAELPLSGTSTDQVLRTPYFTAGTPATYEVFVYDTQGNRTLSPGTVITVAPGSDLAPEPFIRMGNSTVEVGQAVTLDASQSTDPDDPTSSLLVEWDLGNGVFTPPTTDKILTTSFTEAGTRLIRARITDPAGNQTISEPIGVRIISPTKADQSITFGSLPNKTYGAQDFTITATASSGLPVTFTATGNCTVTQVNGTWKVHIIGAGTGTITAHQSGNTQYNAAQDVTRSFTIAKATATIKITPYTGTYDGKPHSATGTATGVNGETLNGLNLRLTTHTNAGTYFLDLWYFTDPTGNYKPAVGAVTDKITKATPTVTVTWHNWTHDGKSHPATGTVTGVNTTNLGTPTFTYYTGTRVDPAHRLSKPPVNAGTYTVVAHYPGNRNYTAADSKPVTVVVR